MANENKYLDYNGVSALWEKVKTKISNTIDGLDYTATDLGAGKTVTAISESNGVISVAAGNISITKSQISDFPTSMTPASHTHGNITNDGKIANSNSATIANGDSIVIADASDSNILKVATAKFDGSTTTSFLTKKGTFESLPTATTAAKGIMQVGTGLSVDNGTVSINSTSANAWNAATTVAAAAANAITAMDYTATGLGTGKTITALTETDGVISVTASNISITKSQISDFPTSMTPASHTHGNITNDGKIGSTANLPLITTTNGVVTTGSFGTAANTFCQGNDSRLSNARTPTSHASSATTYGIGTTTNYGHVKITNGDLSGATNTDGVVAGKAHTHSQYVTQAEFNTKMAASDAMQFKGTLGTGGTITALPASHSKGDTYKVITAATYAGKVCEVGDLIICITDGTAASNDHWTVVQTNIDGAVTGPTSATADAIALYSGTTGKIIKDSAKTISTSVADSDAQIPTSKAVKSFVEGKGYKTTDNDTKNTAGSTNSTSKLFLVGATAQAANPQTYSNVGVYIGTDGCLYSNSAKVLTSSTDTKNTAGTTNKTGTKLFLAGATAQGANPQTYSNSAVYIGTDNCLYSNNTKVVTSVDNKLVGADNTTSKIFLAGPTAQTTSNGAARSYSNSECYASGGYLYSKGAQLIALTALTTDEINAICV